MAFRKAHDISFVVYDFNWLRNSIFTIDWTILIITIRLFVYYPKVVGPIIESDPSLTESSWEECLWDLRLPVLEVWAHILCNTLLFFSIWAKQTNNCSGTKV